MHVRMTRENKTYAEVGKEVFNLFVFTHHVVLAYQ